MYLAETSTIFNFFRLSFYSIAPMPETIRNTFHFNRGKKQNSNRRRCVDARLICDYNDITEIDKHAIYYIPLVCVRVCVGCRTKVDSFSLLCRLSVLGDKDSSSQKQETRKCISREKQIFRKYFYSFSQHRKQFSFSACLCTKYYFIIASYKRNVRTSYNHKCFTPFFFVSLFLFAFFFLLVLLLLFTQKEDKQKKTSKQHHSTNLMERKMPTCLMLLHVIIMNLHEKCQSKKKVCCARQRNTKMNAKMGDN